MTNFVPGNSPLAAELCVALGLDPKQTKGFALHVPCDDLMTLATFHIVTDAQARKVAEVARRWKFTLSEDAPE